MSKKSNVKDEVSWGDAYVVGWNTPDRLVGKIFTVIETMGLKETQEKSSKDIIRIVIWEIFNDSMYLSSNIHNEIRENAAKDSKGYFRSRGDKLREKWFPQE